ncbi:MAG: AAA family ATPase, partial [Fibrobacterota bacterium]
LDEWAAADPGLLEYFGGTSLVSMSHGQSILAFFRARFKVKGLYLLDEPETALSPKHLIAFMGLVRETAAAGHAQFIIASHSPIVLACPGAGLYAFEEERIVPVAYEETEYFRVYRDFLNDRKSFGA